MLRFGPAGNSDSFYEQGYKHTAEQPEWLSKMGLNAYEYSFGRGVRIKDETAAAIGQAFRDKGIMPSCHAPYYINFATVEPDKASNNRRYIADSVHAAKCMGGERVVFHPGVAGDDRTGAVSRIKNGIIDALNYVEDREGTSVAICPETMGKISQIGDLDETLEFCSLDERLIPCIDFGHLYARSLGRDEGDEATQRIIDRMIAVIGFERAKYMHVHFSNIEYTGAGEKKHHNYGVSQFGPDFMPLARLIVSKGLEPTIICESKGRMAEDAALFKKMVEDIREGKTK